MTAFFVPDAEPDDETRYLELAQAVGAPAASPADRILSLRFVHGAEEWTATVGEHLSGQLAARTDRPNARTAPVRRVSDAAVVLAVFDTGDSYLVVTDGVPIGELRDSTWDNPVTVARRDARRVMRFGW